MALAFRIHHTFNAVEMYDKQISYVTIQIIMMFMKLKEIEVSVLFISLT